MQHGGLYRSTDSQSSLLSDCIQCQGSSVGKESTKHLGITKQKYCLKHNRLQVILGALGDYCKEEKNLYNYTGFKSSEGLRDHYLAVPLTTCWKYFFIRTAPPLPLETEAPGCSSWARQTRILCESIGPSAQQQMQFSSE